MRGFLSPTDPSQRGGKKKVSIINTYLKAILEQQVLVCPKRMHTREGLIFTFGDVLIETEDAWLVPCTHTTYAPALPEDIRAIEQSLGFALPESLHHFLQLTNGAQLYVAPLAWKPSWSTKGDYIHYHIFSTLELVKINREMLETFRHFARLDPSYRNIHTLNYVAFCDAHDGNYLAILREGPEQGKVFFLDHEYEFFPYDESTIEAYYTIAESLEAWLELVAKTKGWGGFGRGVPPL
jgi:hypothetical protein